MWIGRNDVNKAVIDINKALNLEGGAAADNYRVVVTFSYEDAPAGRSQSHYVDIDRTPHLIKPGFFCNSGVFVDTVNEIQIYDTASLNAAFGEGTTVTINGQATLVKAVMGIAEFNDPNRPNKQTGFTTDPDGSWVSLANAQGQVPDVNTWGAEHVSALITGIRYNIDRALDNWTDQGGMQVLFDSKSDLAAKPGQMTIDVYRNSGVLDIKVVSGGTSYFYEAITGPGGTVELQSHWDSGVRFTGATVTAIPPGERER